MDALIITSLHNGFRVVGNVVGIAKFLAGEDEIHKILKAIGEQEFKAAKKCLSDAIESQNPRREIESAITIFRVALERDISLETKTIIAIIIAALYRGLNEYILRKKFLLLAKEFFDQDIENLKLTYSVIGGGEEAIEFGKEALQYLFSPSTYFLRKEITKRITKTEEKKFGSSFANRKREGEEKAKNLISNFNELYEFLSNS